MSLDSEVVSDIAAELGIDPAFVEKDWYSVQVLKAISEHQSDTITTIFSGGTSLSKGHGLIQRFSEDLDFRCRYNEEMSGSQKKRVRSAYRKSVLGAIRDIESIELDDDAIEKGGHYMKLPLGYPQHYKGHSALRPSLEIEFSFTQPRLGPELKSIQSLVSKYISGNPETSILCLSPVETGADKLSALTWRIVKRNRDDSDDDPAMIRHLYDLFALSEIIEANQELFVETACSSFEEDQRTGKRDTDKAFHESMLLALSMLSDDEKYQGEYSQFVDAMSYAEDEDNVSFKEATGSFERLIALFE